jgi:hypothetical protein
MVSMLKCSYDQYEPGVSSVSVMEWYKINKSFGIILLMIKSKWNNRCFSVNRDIKISEILNE